MRSLPHCRTRAGTADAENRTGEAGVQVEPVSGGGGEARHSNQHDARAIQPSIKVWQTALNQRRTPLSVSRLPGCGHFPTLAADSADLDEAGPISPLYEQLLADWLSMVALPAKT
jgi:hypothetical protein